MTKQESDRSVWAENYNSYKCALSAARIIHFSDVINTNINNPRFLFETFRKLTKNNPPPSSSFTTDEFLNFFTSKIELIINKIDPHNNPDTVDPGDHLICIFSQFEMISRDTLSKFVNSS